MESPLVTPRDMQTNLAALAAQVARARRIRAAFQSGAGFLAAVALALVLAQFGLVKWALGTLALGLVGAGCTFVWKGVRHAGRAGMQALETATAKLAERLAPELGTSPSSAIDFSYRLAARDSVLPFSRDLAQAHLERTTHALDDIDLVGRLRKSRRERRRRQWGVLVLAAVAATAAVAGLSQGRRRLVRMIVDPSAPQFVDLPLAADIRVTYRYPAYTGLAERVVEGGDGSIAAVVGTEVELAAGTDEPIRSALFKVDNTDGTSPTAVPMLVDGRRMSVRFQVQRDSRYHFAITTRGGDKLEERARHAIHAVADAPPEVTMLTPIADIELRDNQRVPIAYAAKDDFGISEINLVVEVVGAKEPKRLPIVSGQSSEPKRDGSYMWSVRELGLTAGAEARFYLEAIDNDAISGPKRGLSAAHRLVLFSAQKHHDDIMARQQQVLDALVDWLGEELAAPYPATSIEADKNVPAQQRLLEVIRRLNAELSTLVPLIRDDKLAGAGVATAFGNIREHTQRAERERSQLLARLAVPGVHTPLHQAMAREQRRDIADLEKDIVYLDDLLAIQRIDQLKASAKDLLSAQHELQKLLAQYKQTQDPALKEELTRRIRELKEQMLGLLARMAEIKQQLPGEYRNLESASQLAVGDELERIEQALKSGNLDAAAKELEQLADMIQNMSDRLGNAEERFGGERYAEVRKQLADFAHEFEALENEQQAAAKRSEELANQLRDKTLERAGGKLDDFVKKARDKTAQALKSLDEVHLPDTLFGVSDRLALARERLLDLDALLKQKDLAEALRAADEASKREDELGLAVDPRAARYGQSAQEFAHSADAVGHAKRRTHEVADMLAKLFPDASQVFNKDQLEQMRGVGRKQAELEGKANKLAERLQELAQQMPLFGGEPRASLENARGEMGQAANDLGSGELPGGAMHGRRAADELGKLRQALEQASKSGKGGLPLPLAMNGASQGGEQEGDGAANSRHEDVQIPNSDKNRAAPQFRKELLEAAKQKAPLRYEDAVRRYYEELIR